MKRAIIINCVVLVLLATGSIVMGGSTTVEEFGAPNFDADGGFMYVEHVNGNVCRTWGAGVWSDAEEPFNLYQEARDVEENTGTIESTKPRWEVGVWYYFELEVGVDDGSNKGWSEGTPLGMVWGDIQGADGYKLQTNVEWGEQDTGKTAVSYQAIAQDGVAFPASPVAWFWRSRTNDTGGTQVIHVGRNWEKTVKVQALEFHACSYTHGKMIYYLDQTEGVWFTVNGGEAGETGILYGSVQGFDDLHSPPLLVDSWDLD